MFVLQKLEAELDAFKLRIDRITVRKVCRALERHICLAVVGSKRKVFESLYNIAMVECSEYAPRLKEVLAKLGLPSAAIIDNLKEIGDEVVREGHATLYADLARDLRVDVEPDSEYGRSLEAFLAALKHFGMVDPEGAMDCSDPCKGKA